MWKTSEKRKVIQRALNKVVRNVNKNIENDNLWRGRFRIYQTNAWWEPYYDGTHHLVVELCFYDKKTGMSVNEIVSANRAMNWHGNWLFIRMNDFICVDCNVWANEGFKALKNDTTCYKEMR